MLKNINWFREATPYIKFHRNQTFVILLTEFNQIKTKRVLLDIALLNSLGIKIILVCGVRNQIDAYLSTQNITSEIVDNLRITDGETLACVKQCNALLKLDIEAIFSAGGHKTVSGNFITAQPIGIINGVDFQHTGKIRQIDTAAIKQQLDNIVLLSPLGYANTGDIFNLNAENLASLVAAELMADKLIILHNDGDLMDEQSQLISELTTKQAQIQTKYQAIAWQRYLDSAIYACEHRTKRVHILNLINPESLLQELFSSDGSGVMITTDPYETIRVATKNDINTIMQLITPEINQQILISRTKEQINPNQYYLLERDQTTIGLMALINHQTVTELASLVIAKPYQNCGRGKRLLNHALKICQKQQYLFVLSTQTSHWFLDNGFEAADLSLLPTSKSYDTQRNAKMYLIKLA